MQARSALFDLYGDHLRDRGGVAPVAALVMLLAPLGVAAPAVRTSVSRMVRQGWLTPVDTERGPGYALTPRADRWLDDAAMRIYRTRSDAWDGRWAVAVIPHLTRRSGRERLQRALGYLGYRELHPGTWVAPRFATDLESTVQAEGVTPTVFRGEHVGDDLELLRLWKPDELAERYRLWLRSAAEIIGPHPEQSSSDRHAFATRSTLVHEWRKFLFADPGLPRELLPSDWPGDAAAAFFDEHAARLAPAAGRFVDDCLRGRTP